MSTSHERWNRAPENRVPHRAVISANLVALHTEAKHATSRAENKTEARRWPNDAWPCRSRNEHENNSDAKKHRSPGHANSRHSPNRPKASEKSSTKRKAKTTTRRDTETSGETKVRKSTKARMQSTTRPQDPAHTHKKPLRKPTIGPLRHGANQSRSKPFP